MHVCFMCLCQNIFQRNIYIYIFFGVPMYFFFFFFIYFYQLEANYFTILQWFLSYIDMNQPWIYMYSPSLLPPPSLPDKGTYLLKKICKANSKIGGLYLEIHFLFSKIYFIQVQLIYNVMLISAVQQSDLHTYICMCVHIYVHNVRTYIHSFSL